MSIEIHVTKIEAIGYGPSAEPVQGFLAGVSWIGACGDRRTGLDTVVGAGRGGSVEIL
jgi:hypothetical protein